VPLTLTIRSHFYECGSLSPFAAIFLSAAHFHHLQPFLWVQLTYTICSHFMNAAHFNHLQPFLLVRLPFSICSHFYECGSLSPFAAIFMSAAHFHHLQEF